MSASLTLHYGEYEFPKLPRISIERQADATSASIGLRWTLRGELSAKDQSTLATLSDQLREALQESGESLELKLGDTPLHSIDADVALSGPQLESMSLDPLEEKSFQLTQKYQAVMRATIPLDEQAATTLASLEITHETSADKPPRILWIGCAHRVNDTSDDDAISELAPTLADGYRRIQQRFSFAADHAIRFEVIDEQTWQQLPSGVSDGHFVRTRAINANGQLTETTAGYFIGEHAEAQARAMRPARARLLNEQVSFDAFTRKATFSFEALVRGGGPSNSTQRADLATTIEHVTYSEKRRVVSLPLLGRSSRYRQETGVPEYRIEQAGKSLAPLRAGPPEPPLYPSDLIEREVRYASARNSEGLFETRWRYVFARSRPVLR